MRLPGKFTVTRPGSGPLVRVGWLAVSASHPTDVRQMGPPEVVQTNESGIGPRIPTERAVRSSPPGLHSWLTMLP
jgi:hypothetical protein